MNINIQYIIQVFWGLQKWLQSHFARDSSPHLRVRFDGPDSQGSVFDIKTAGQTHHRRVNTSSFPIRIPPYIQTSLSGFCHVFIVLSEPFPLWWVLMPFWFLCPSVSFFFLFSFCVKLPEISLYQKHNLYFIALDLSSFDSEPKAETHGMRCCWMLTNSSM